MTCEVLSPAQVRAAIAAGARLVDIRDAGEHAREHIPGALNVPLDRIEGLPAGAGGPVVFHCRSGMRTAANAERLVRAAGGGAAYILDGGIEGWRRAGEATVVDSRQPIEIMRQVQIAAGSLVLLGVLLGWVVAPAFFVLAAFVGAGLAFAGATGWCGMANLLRLMPWNRHAGA